MILGHFIERHIAADKMLNTLIWYVLRVRVRVRVMGRKGGGGKMVWVHENTDNIDES